VGTDPLVTQALSLGISGLLFVMWWYERQERARNASNVQEALHYMNQIADVNEHLLDVIRANTEALAGLREELRAGRGAEAEWRARVSRQIEQLQGS
jgi:hypothetical protein